MVKGHEEIRRKIHVDGMEILTFSYRRVPHLTPCKVCGRYDDKVEFQQTPTGVKLGAMHDHCLSGVIHETMKELIMRMHMVPIATALPRGYSEMQPLV